MKIRVLTAARGGVNAIDDASRLLVEALERAGHDAQAVPRVRGGVSKLASSADLLVLPYNPFMWGRWGLAPGLVGDVVAARRRRRGKLVLVVHEPYVPIHNPKSLLLGLAQRAQLGALLLLVDRRFASIEPWATRLSRVRPTSHLPSGSNVPDARSERTLARAEIGVRDELVVATLSTGHPSHLTAYVEAALIRLARDGVPTCFLQLGAGAATVAVPRNMRAVRPPGVLSSEKLGALLSAADLLLAPFVDGISTRRTSVMAGFCEAIAVVGTRGELTDPTLNRTGLELVDVGKPDHFAALASALATDSERRARAAAAGRQLFEAEFTTDRIAARFLLGIES